MDEAGNKPILSQIGPLLLLVWIFLINFLSRIIFSPLLPTIEKDLAIGHGEAGSLFLVLSLGYCIMLVASGFVTSRLHHRRAIALSAIVMAASLFAISLSRNVWGFQAGLFFLGLSAGLYLPSGIATITDLVRSEDWGKAIAIHEFAPNLGFVAAPFVVDVLLDVLGWREILGGLGIVSLFSGLVFMRLGKGGSFCGELPKMGTLRSIVAQPSFWIITVLLSLGIGSSFGIYSMLPLYLISERRLESSWANALVGLSRIPTVGTPILAGWFTDRLGPKRTLGLIFLISGVCTILLGLLDGSWMIPMVFLQPMVAAAFFPPAFTALAKLSSPALKNVTVSLAMPVGFLLGGGAIPAALGFTGEWRSFSLGIMLFGGIVLGGAVLARRLRFREE